MNKIAAAACFAVLTGLPLIAPNAHAEAPCAGARDTALTGTVRDSTEALLPGSIVQIDGARGATTGPDGRFRLPCVAPGAHKLTVTAEGFAETDLPIKTPRNSELQITLKPASVAVDVTVNGDSQAVGDTSSSGATETLSGKQLQSLADDPDDLQRELQQLGAAGGGNPANTTIAVDGFQGSGALPPKSSIAYIKVNPDMFSAEYREPPFDGGRVEVYTKPGQSAFHGALYTTNGSPWENARDPFSNAKGTIGKQRYGFELTGPVRKQGSDFTLDLEHRQIDNVAVVNAFTLDAAGNTVHTADTVNAPQTLWVGQARLDWQLGAKNTFIGTYSTKTNSLLNENVGGTNLAETGYNGQTWDNAIRLTDITTASAHLMHEARLQLRWDGENDSPASTAPQLQVAGAFTGGGAVVGAQRLHEFNIEADDDAILTAGHHTLKFGTQLFVYDEHEQYTTNFNGTYIFGGGTAPILDANNQPLAGQTETITGLEQYRRSLLSLPGGTPTAFNVITGTPTINFTQVEDVLYIQDDWTLPHGVKISGGLRYFNQNAPTITNDIDPRAGILWAPNKKGTWTLHAHAGLFSGRFGEGDYSQFLDEDGVHRITSTTYNPVYGSGTTTGSTIFSARTLAPHLGQDKYSIENVGGTRSLPGGWNLSLDLYAARLWNEEWSKNINAPLNGQPTGPRPGAANTDIYQVQNSSQGFAYVEFAGLEQHSIKWLQLFVGGVHVDQQDQNDDNTFATPQSSFTNAGELAYRDNNPVWIVFGNASITFPKKVVLSGDLNGQGAQHYNVLTGYDNNGDGAFNDRPQYAAPGAPLCSATVTTTGCAYQTPYGLLTSADGVGVLQRDIGVMPWRVYLDTNIQRAFTLTRNPKAEHQQTLTVNVRSSNILNHTNVTSVGGTLGSPLFATPYAADNGRRVEAGLRYTF